MTHNAAKQNHLPPGFALRLDSTCGMTVYLADYRRAGFPTTVYPSSAEYFAREIDASEMARRLECHTGQRWVVVKAPQGEHGSNSHASNCCCKEHVQFKDGRKLNITETKLALENALETFAAEIGDEEWDMIRASMAFHLPVSAPRFLR